MAFLYGNAGAVRVRNRRDSTYTLKKSRPQFGIDLDSQNLSLILHRYFNPYILPIISDVHGVDLSIWLQISVRPLQSIPHPHLIAYCTVTHSVGVHKFHLGALAHTKNTLTRVRACDVCV